MRADLLGVVSIVETETPHRLDVLRGQRRQQQANVGDVIRHVVSSKDVASDDASLSSLCDVRNASGQDRIAVVSLAIAGQEANEPLGVCQWIHIVEL